MEDREYRGGPGCIKDMLDREVNPYLDIIAKLSASANNFACAANHVSNVNATESHELKELLDLVFDIRKLAERIFDAAEDSFDDFVKEIKDSKEK